MLYRVCPVRTSYLVNESDGTKSHVTEVLPTFYVEAVSLTEAMVKAKSLTEVGYAGRLIEHSSVEADVIEMSAMNF